MPNTPQDQIRKRRLARSQAMAETVVAAFTERLKDEAEKQGGFLSERNIDDLNAEFQKKPTNSVLSLIRLSKTHSVSKKSCAGTP